MSRIIVLHVAHHCSALLHVIHHLHQLLSDGVSLFHCLRLAVDTDDRFGVALAQMNPLVGEVNLHTVDVGNLHVLLAGKHLLHFHEDSVDVG